MDIGTAAVICGIGIPSLGLLYKIIPSRLPEKGVLKEADFERLDGRVKIYERVASLESSQAHHGELLAGLKADNGIIFEKIDDLKDLILKEMK